MLKLEYYAQPICFPLHSYESYQPSSKPVRRTMTMSMTSIKPYLIIFRDWGEHEQKHSWMKLTQGFNETTYILYIGRHG